ncbi:cation:proton antiporter [bacterium]|jgi:Kef-type K+ transport system membrane component KefB|nr:cation:proton antiporter [bacterium]
MFEDVVLLITLSLIVIFSPFIAKIVRIPTTPVEIILGAIFAYAGLLHEQYLFELVAQVGFLYLMFIAGTEVDLKKVLRTNRALMKRILIYLVLLYIFSISFTLYFDLGKIFIVLLPLISVGLVVTLSKEYGKTPWLTLGMTAGGIGEVISIAVLTMTATALQDGFGMEFLKSMGALVFFIFIIYLLFRALQLLFWWFPGVGTALMPHDDNKEQDLRLSIGILFILIAVMLYLHLELAFGAFIAGIFIPTFFIHKQDLPHRLASYGFGFLIPVFFIYIGTTFNLDSLFMDGLVTTALIITASMIAMRVLSALVFKNILGYRSAILLGLSHSMPLTLLIAVATIAYHSSSIDKLHYFAFILAALFQVIIVTVLIKFIHKEPSPASVPKAFNQHRR